MMANPKLGQRVMVWYGKRYCLTMPLHGKIGTVVVVCKARRCRNHGVSIDGQMFVIPCGNLRKVTETPMDANTYQKLAARTLIAAPGFEIGDNDMMIIWNALGLAGEAGEVAEMVKKGILHQHGLDREKLAKEIGDACWYIAALCTTLGLTLEEVMAANIEKLKTRYPQGFRSEDSVKRVDVGENQ